MLDFNLDRPAAIENGGLRAHIEHASCEVIQFICSVACLRIGVHQLRLCLLDWHFALSCYYERAWSIISVDADTCCNEQTQIVFIVSCIYLCLRRACCLLLTSCLATLSSSKAIFRRRSCSSTSFQLPHSCTHHVFITSSSYRGAQDLVSRFFPML